jgi:hypothetical protein
VSSLVRRIQRTIKRRGKARFYQDRGSKLGVHRVTPEKPSARRGSRRGHHTFDKGVIVTPIFAPPVRPVADVEAHRAKMEHKRNLRSAPRPEVMGAGIPDHFSIWPEGKTATPARMGVRHDV